MGVYSTVMADLDCERCRSAFRADVQFYSDDDRDMPVYSEGEAVPALPANSVFEGITDAFCDACRTQWVDDERDAGFEELARDVARGDVVARFATNQMDLAHPERGRQLTVLRPEPLSVDEVRALARRPWRFGTIPNFGARLYEATVLLFRGEEMVPSGLREDFLERVEARLVARGWGAHAASFSRDVVVRVDAETRVRVER